MSTLPRPLFAAALSASLALGSTGRGQEPVQQSLDIPPVSDNAALQYWQAFAMLPALDAEQEKILENWSTTPLDDAANKILDQSRPSLMFLHRGGERRACDWGLDYHDGVQLYLPHLAKSRTLCRIAALHARREVDAGRPEEALQAAGDMFLLARQVGTDLTLVSTLVDYAIEGMTIDLLAAHLPELKMSFADAVKAAASLPPAPVLAHTLRGEKIMSLRMIEDLKAAEARKPGSWRDLWISIFQPEVPDAVKNATSLDETVRLTQGAVAYIDELVQMVELPPAEFDVQYPAFTKRVAAENPLAELLLPAMVKVTAARRRCEARQAMLLAAIGVVESGPEKLAELKDPFGDGPFGYRDLGNGAFELSSKLKFEDKPVTLTIGKKPGAQ